MEKNNKIHFANVQSTTEIKSALKNNSSDAAALLLLLL